MVAELVVLPDKLRHEVESVFELDSKALALGFDDDYLQYLYSKESGRGFSGSCANSIFTAANVRIFPEISKFREEKMKIADYSSSFRPSLPWSTCICRMAI